MRLWCVQGVGERPFCASRGALAPLAASLSSPSRLTVDRSPLHQHSLLDLSRYSKLYRWLHCEHTSYLGTCRVARSILGPSGGRLDVLGALGLGEWWG